MAWNVILISGVWVRIMYCRCSCKFISVVLSNPSGPSMVAANPSTAAVGSSIGIAIGVSVSVTFVVSFSMGMLVASVLCYISRRSKESSHNSGSHAEPATVYDEVGSTKKRDAMEMNTNTAYGSYVSQSHEGDSIR
eukprot:Em0005g420a